MTTETYPTADQLEIRALKARAKGPFNSLAEIRDLMKQVERFWVRTGSPAAEALLGDLLQAEQEVE